MAAQVQEVDQLKAAGDQQADVANEQARQQPAAAAEAQRAAEANEAEEQSASEEAQPASTELSPRPTIDKSLDLQLIGAARSKGLAEVTDLLTRGADPNAKGGQNGGTPLHFAALYNSNVEVLRALLEAGADTNSKTYAGETPLVYAAIMGKLVFVELLCARGADITIKNNEGKTALQVAQEQNKSAVVAFLQQQQ